MLIVSKRSFLRGLVAAPAVVAIGSLMRIHGIIMPTNRTAELIINHPNYHGPGLWRVPPGIDRVRVITIGGGGGGGGHIIERSTTLDDRLRTDWA